MSTTSRPSPPVKRKTLEPAEARRILSELRDRRSAARDHFVFRFLLNTGLRVSELVGLDVGDVEDREAITFRGKGGKVRTVPLNKRTRALAVDFLRHKKRAGEALDPDAPLLVSRKHGRLSTRAIEDLVQAWATRCGVNGGAVTPHTLRRTFGTAVYRERGIMAAKTLLGHSFVNTTQLYVKADELDAAEAVEALSF